MTLDTAYPFGMRDIQLFPFTNENTETLDAPLVLPAARTLTWTEAEDFEELRGNDQRLRSRGKGPTGSWELEGGGYNADVVAALYGGAVNDSGITPNQIRRFRKKVTDSRPYFRVEGKAISDNGGDVHAILYRCRATGDFPGEFADGGWYLTHASGEMYGSNGSGVEGVLYDIIYNETESDIARLEIQAIVIDGSGGTFTATYSGQTTGALAFNISAVDLTTALEALNNIAPGDVFVEKDGSVYRVTFMGALKGPQPQMTVDGGNLTGQSTSAAVYTIQNGL